MCNFFRNRISWLQRHSIPARMDRWKVFVTKMVSDYLKCCDSPFYRLHNFFLIFQAFVIIDFPRNPTSALHKNQSLFMERNYQICWTKRSAEFCLKKKHWVMVTSLSREIKPYDSLVQQLEEVSLFHLVLFCIEHKGDSLLCCCFMLVKKWVNFYVLLLRCKHVRVDCSIYKI